MEDPMESTVQQSTGDTKIEDAMQDSETRKCRICLSDEGTMIAACNCTGSVRYTHEECLRDWILHRSARRRSGEMPLQDEIIKCEICHAPYNVQVTTQTSPRWLQQLPLQLFSFFVVATLGFSIFRIVDLITSGRCFWSNIIVFSLLIVVTLFLLVRAVLRMRENVKETVYDFSASPRSHCRGAEVEEVVVHESAEYVLHESARGVPHKIACDSSQSPERFR